MKTGDIVKPSNLGHFLHVQLGCLSEELQQLTCLARFDHVQKHLPGQPTVELMAWYQLAQNPALEISFLVSDRHDELLHAFEALQSGPRVAQQLGVAWVELKKGIHLEPVQIPKPWGQEIWYTGIEQRGVSRVRSESGVTPLDWVLAAAPGFVMAEDATPILLKVLDPLPAEVFGDLYFEMHERKQEVYIVTHVDERAWPDGKGGIRLGFNQDLRKRFSSDENFRQAYLKAVQDYRQVRRQVDDLLDIERQQAGIGLRDPVMPATLQRWLQQLPADLLQAEQGLRAQMEGFIAIQPLAVGDVVQVPCYTPHSLQHGVRTVEFQTPVYERKILSFAQKVLTQDHWDTESAVPHLLLDEPQLAPLPELEQNAKVRREQVVAFSDFTVERLTLAPRTRWQAPAAAYQLLMLVAGCADFNEQPLLSEQARLLPLATALELASGDEAAIILLARRAS